MTFDVAAWTSHGIMVAGTTAGRVYRQALAFIVERLSDERLLEEEYHSVVKRDRLIDHTTSASQLPEHGSRNRYVNVLPYDYNRVKISTNPGANLCSSAPDLDSCRSHNQTGQNACMQGV